MEGAGNNAGAVSFTVVAAEAAAESQVLPVSERMAGGGGDKNGAVPFTGVAAEAAAESVEVAVGSELEEKLKHSGGDGGHTGVAAPLSGSGVEAAKRKRGRPRKEPPAELGREFVAAPDFSATPLIKRGRGRPKGSGKWQSLAVSLGKTTVDSTGSNFTPHIVAVQAGENIVERICSFSQRAFESICILSASGIVLTAELLRPGSPSSILRHEGQFEIVSLSGSHLNNGRNGKICRLSVQLAYPNGSLFGGAVADSLIAGGPVQVVIATFRENLVGEQQHLPARRFVEPSVPNNVYVPLVPTSNGQVQDGEQVPTVDAPPYNGVDRLTNHHDVNRASPQQFDWNNNSLQSCSTMSQHLFPRLNNTDE
ncbi:hypothetical protein ABFS83_14G236900 [Erythranthe nasuta]